MGYEKKVLKNRLKEETNKIKTKQNNVIIVMSHGRERKGRNLHRLTCKTV